MCLCSVPVPVWIHVVIKPQPGTKPQAPALSFPRAGTGDRIRRGKMRKLWVEMKTV